MSLDEAITTYLDAEPTTSAKATAVTAATLGAALAALSPEAQEAAIERSRRIPEPGLMRAAWASLPADVRDRMGTLALTQSFYGLAGTLTVGRELTLSAAEVCEERANDALGEFDALARAALPGLYGTDGKAPLWDTQPDQPILQAHRADTALSPMRQAILDHIAAEWMLSEVLDRPEDDPERRACAEAEEAADQAVIRAPIRDRADLMDYYEHVAQRSTQSPAGDPYAKALDALGLALQVGGAVQGGSGSTGPDAPMVAALKLHEAAFGPVPSPIRLAITLHRGAFERLRAAGPFDGEDPRMVALDQAEHQAMAALLAAPYADPSDATVLLTYLKPFLAEERHPVLSDSGELACAVLTKVLDVCTRALAVAGDGAARAGDRGAVFVGDGMGLELPAGSA